jgi:hypothetical protein
MDADRLAFITAIVEYDTIDLRPDLFEAEGDRGLTVQPGPPVGIQLGPSPMNRDAVAVALHARVFVIEVEQRVQIAGPAGVEPVDDDGYPVKVVGQCGVLFARGGWFTASVGVE